VGGPTCENGHLISREDRFCRTCGAPADRPEEHPESAGSQEPASDPAVVTSRTGRLRHRLAELPTSQRWLVAIGLAAIVAIAGFLAATSGGSSSSSGVDVATQDRSALMIACQLSPSGVSRDQVDGGKDYPILNIERSGANGQLIPPAIGGGTDQVRATVLYDYEAYQVNANGHTKELRVYEPNSEDPNSPKVGFSDCRDYTGQEQATTTTTSLVARGSPPASGLRTLNDARNVIRTAGFQTCADGLSVIDPGNVTRTPQNGDLLSSAQQLGTCTADPRLQLQVAVFASPAALTAYQQRLATSSTNNSGQHVACAQEPTITDGNLLIWGDGLDISSAQAIGDAAGTTYQLTCFPPDISAM
jgi:hypothetical protein